MAFTTRQAASEDKSAQQAAVKPSVQLFNDQRASTSVQLKQQQLMQTAQSPAQFAAEEEEPLQGKFATAQLAEEEELLQGKFDTAQLAEEEELLQGKFSTTQLMEEEEPLQGKFETAQLAEEEELLQGKFSNTATAQLEEKPNNTGLPNQLKSGIESLSGMSLDGVKVHYNSDKPAQLNAHAYAQGTDIHVAPGQEQHLPHEAWHVVQQAQGRVKPTTQMKGTSVNDDVGLETEADVMGAKALGHAQMASKSTISTSGVGQFRAYVQTAVQRKCSLCSSEDDTVQKKSKVNPVIQMKGTITECEAYHAGYKATPPKKCTQNNTKPEMEANVIATQQHIDGRQQYIDEECDDVLPGSIAKGSGVALASHLAELDSVKRTLATCNDKIARGKYKT